MSTVEQQADNTSKDGADTSNGDTSNEGDTRKGDTSKEDTSKGDASKGDTSKGNTDKRKGDVDTSKGYAEDVRVRVTNLEKQLKDQQVESQVIRDQNTYLEKLLQEKNNAKTLEDLIMEQMKELIASQNTLKDEVRKLSEQLANDKKAHREEIKSYQQKLDQVLANQDQAARKSTSVPEATPNIGQVISDTEEIKNQMRKIPPLLNKNAMDNFTVVYRQLVARLFPPPKGPLKLFDENLNKLLEENLELIQNEWRAHIQSETDVTKDIEILQRKISAAMHTLANTKSTKQFSQYISSNCKPPSLFPSPVSPNTLVGNAYAGMPYIPAICNPSMTFLYYDVDEKEVTGLVPIICDSFREASLLDMKYIQIPCVILTFIFVHDRLDMDVWIKKCEARSLKGKHYVILVCNELGDSAKTTTDKLACSKLYKATFRTELNNTGMGSSASVQKINDRSLQIVLDDIKRLLAGN